MLQIFAKSADEFTLILFGSEETRNNFANGAENVYFCEEEMQTAKIDWLKFIANEITPNEHLDGDCKYLPLFDTIGGLDEGSRKSKSAHDWLTGVTGTKSNLLEVKAEGCGFEAYQLRKHTEKVFFMIYR